MAQLADNDGFAELLNFSHMVAPEVLGLKNGGLLAGFCSLALTLKVRQFKSWNI